MLTFNELDIPQNYKFALSPKGIRHFKSIACSHKESHYSEALYQFVPVLFETIEFGGCKWVKNLYCNWLIAHSQACIWVY